MASPRRRRHSRARWLAPLALVVAGIAVYAVVDPGSSGDSTTTSTRTTAPRTTTTKARRAKHAKARTYTVRTGDTLSAIAARTGVSLQRIQQLNPKLDSQTLQTGETIKLGP